MVHADLTYGQKILVAYTGLDGFERAKVIEMHWLNKLTRKRKRKLIFKKKFPFIDFKIIEFTDVLLNSGSETFPKWNHIYAFESPRLMAQKFGIEYEDVNVALVNDDLQ